MVTDSGIYSSSEAFNEEMHLDLERLRNWVGHFGFEFRGRPPDRWGRGGERGFHASGHIHGPRIKEMVDTIRPRVLIAVHTESPGWFLERFRGRHGLRVLVPGPGKKVTLPLR